MKKFSLSYWPSFLCCISIFFCFSILPNFSTAQCNLGSITLNVVDAPEAEVVDHICDFGLGGYQVVFTISAGDSNSYTVTSSITGILAGPPYTFTSDLIPSGDPYQFIVSDENACDQVILEGSYLCVCPNSAGTMELDTLEFCDGDTAIAAHNGDEVLEASDTLVFILHDGDSSSLGTVIDTSGTPVFNFTPPLEIGQTYFISAVSGDNDGIGSVDLDDPCLSVAVGTPIIWTALPEGNLLDDVEICEGDSTPLVFSLSGTGPFDITYAIDTFWLVLENIDSLDTLFVSPSITTTYALISVEDGSMASCSSSILDTAIVAVNEPVTQNTAAQICDGDSILLGGEMQTVAGVYTDSLNTVAGCDSIIMTALAIYTLDTTAISNTNCDPTQIGVFEEIFIDQNGCDSTVITSVALAEADSSFLTDTTCDPALAGIFEETLTNQLGCDSVVTTTVSLLSTDTTEVSGTSCDPSQVGVFEEILSNQNGCDSLVISTVTYSVADSVFLFDSTCDPTLAGVFEETFTSQLGCDSVVTTTIDLLPTNETNLTGTTCDPAQAGVFLEIFSNQYGCDSTVITEVVYAPADSTFFEDTSCDPTQTGVFEEIFTGQFGCDSVVTTTVSLLPSDLVEVNATSCDPTQVGVFPEILTNQNGCDSTVITTITYAAVDSTFFVDTTCDPTQAGVFSEIFTNQLGCDSVATTTVLLLPSDMTELEDTSCDPSQVGVFTDLLTNQFGCDSTVVLTVSLLPSDETFLDDSTCDPVQAGMFTEILTNQFGCDSMVTTTVALLPSDETFLTDSTCDPTQTGVFTEIFTSQNGCDSVVNTTVNLLSPNECSIEFFLTADPIPCDIDLGSMAIDISLGQLPMDYSFMDSSGNNGSGIVTSNPFFISQLTAGQYTITLTNANGISVSEEIEIVQAAPPIVGIDLINGLACVGDQTGAVVATATGDFPPYTYQWSNGAATPGISNLIAGNYSVTVFGPFGCEASAQVIIEEPLDIEVMFIVNNPDCFNEEGGYVQVEASGGSTPYQFALNGSDFQSENIFNGLSSGVYQITVQDANGCEQVESFAINAPILADVNLGDDDTIQLGDGVTINAIVNLPDSLLSNIEWSGLGTDLECPTCLTQATVPLVTTTYSISIESSDGCTDDDDMTIFVDRRRQVFVPNVFSPNGDGVNDFLFPFAKANSVAKIHSFLIFSRWGETVFEAYGFQPNDPGLGWDGQHKGEPMRPAVFAWFAEIEFIDGQAMLFEGDVVLVR